MTFGKLKVISAGSQIKTSKKILVTAMSVLSVTVINPVRVGLPRKIITRIMVLGLPLLVSSLLEYQVSDLLVKSWLESPDRELLVLLEYPGREL